MFLSFVIGFCYQWSMAETLTISLPEEEEKSMNHNLGVHIYLAVFPTSSTFACPEAQVVTTSS